MEIKNLDQNIYSQLIKKSKNNLAILPLGSIEQHGEHLPFATDSLIVEYIADIVSKKTDSFLLPTFYYGTSFEHEPLFNISINYNILVEVLSNICLSLFRQNINHLFIINGHHGNTGLLQYVGQNISLKYSMKNNFIYVINYWQLLDRKFDHAGEVETSLMKAIHPDLVKMDLAKPGLQINKKKKEKSLINTGISMSINNPGRFVKFTKNGIWGNPIHSNIDQGRKMLSEIIDKAILLVSDIGYR